MTKFCKKISNEKMSRKQKIYQNYQGLFSIIALISIVLLIISIQYNCNWSIAVNAIILIISVALTLIFEHLEEKEFQRVTNKSVEYYKNKKWLLALREIFAALGSLLAAAILIDQATLNLDLNIIFSICIGTFSLVPIIYIFILPQIREIIDITRKKLSQVYKQLYSSKKEADIKLLKKKQGDLYKLINSCNHINYELIISFVYFATSIFCFYAPDRILSSVYPTASIIYSFYFVFILIKITSDYNSYNNKEIEDKLNNQILNLENKKKFKFKKELLKIFTKEGKFLGQVEREKCLNSQIDGFYKTAYIIIRNKNNKYFAYQEIVDFSKAQYRWNIFFKCEELLKQNLKDTIIERVKINFGFKINKNNFKLIRKSIDLDKHQLIEVYLVEADIHNSDIDYNIDLFYYAKFISYEKFLKLITSSESFSKDIIQQIKIKLMK